MAGTESAAMFTSPELRWQALRTRDPRSASAFAYAVTTTRIYCRPTCPARLARRANVLFFDKATEAAAAGFRACKRCKPAQSQDMSARGRHEEMVKRACEAMDATGGRVTLRTIAESAGLSPRYFHGVFKKVVGVTPGEYAARLRAGEGSSSETTRPSPESIDVQLPDLTPSWMDIWAEEMLFEEPDLDNFQSQLDHTSGSWLV